MDKIYLDNAATTKPIIEAVATALNNTVENGFFNPSAMYSGGMNARLTVEEAREALLSYFPSGWDMIFTSCGSESDNTALLSFANHGNVVISAGEHSAVYNTLNSLKQHGAEIRIAPILINGAVDVNALVNLVDEKTSIVSVVHVNNETGAINDINTIARLVKQKNPDVIFHSDGVQAFMKIVFRPSADIDTYAVSAHKIGGLKGVGALFFRKGIHLKPLINGGGQEKTLRSGTENTFGIEVFKLAFDRRKTVEENFARTEKIKEIFCSNLPKCAHLISDDNCSPYVVSFSIPGVKAEIMQRLLDREGIFVGTGSACSSKNGVSRIISACGLDKKIAEGTLRVSFGFDTKEDEVVFAAKKICECAKKLLKVLK